jgi:phosphoribosylanthranilate isomerase
VSCLIKICGLKYAASVDAAVEAGADAVGFVFAKSVRQVTVRHATFIAANVPEHILRVAVMKHPSVEEWEEVQTIFCPDILQTDAEDFRYLEVPDDITKWPVIREGKVPGNGDLPGTFVYEGVESGQGATVDWSIAGKLAERARLILAGGLGPENVAAAIRQVGPFGVDVSSAVESAPGAKDPDMIRAFIEAVRATPNPGSDQSQGHS